MGYKRFSLLLTLRLALILLSLLVASYLLTQPGFYASLLLTAMVIVFQGWEMYHFVARTNQELSRFLDAVRYADFNQKFDLAPLGANFPVLADTLNGIMARYREDRSLQEAELHHIKGLVEQVPIPLISLYTDDQLMFWNNAARRLFSHTELSHVSGLKNFGMAFYRAVMEIQPGERRLSAFIIDELEMTLAIAASEIIIAGRTEKILSLQNIQQELDDTQLDAWQALVRVLTHEILNSITPVASLSKTSVHLLDDLTDRLAAELELSDDLSDELSDIKEAVETVARRSDGLMNFVGSYRKLTRLPSPQREQLSINALFANVLRIMSARDDVGNLAVKTLVLPESLTLQADAAMVEQILINLLQNAAQASNSHGSTEVTLSARLNRRGSVTIDVKDDGPGIPADLLKQVFVPFFTTRRDGSGVGLALSRQIMIAHGGSIAATNSPGGGAVISLSF